MEPSLPVRREISPGRVVVVAAGLIAGGAVAGATAGVLGATVWLALTEGIQTALDPQVWAFAGVIGAPFGAVLLPLAGFTALRRVPLGRLLAWTTIATALGGVVGVTIFGGAWLGGAIAGFFGATGWLWFRSRRRD